MYNDLTAWLGAWRQWQDRAVADLRPRWAVNHQIMFDLELTPAELERAGAPPGPARRPALVLAPGSGRDRTRPQDDQARHFNR
jgi:hypothetical protein